MSTERELCQTYGVSRSTMRQALAQLEAMQRIYRRQGKGTFVAKPKIEQRLELFGHTEGMRARGLSPSSKLIDVRRIAAGAEVGNMLMLAPEAEVLRIERLRLADEEPVALDVLFLNAHRFDGISTALDDDGSLYQLLSSDYGVQLASAEETIEAVIAERREARLLKCKPGAPLLMLCRRAHDTNGMPTEFARSLYRGDRFRFQTDLQRSHHEIAPIHKNAGDVTVRVARSDEGRALARVLIEAWRGYRGIVNDVVIDALDEDDVADWLATLISMKTTKIFLAESPTGQVIGFTRCDIDTDPPGNGHIVTLYVVPTENGRGVARRLLDASISELDPRREHKVSAWIFEEDHFARGLYESAGFVPDGSRRVEERNGAQEIRMRRVPAAPVVEIESEIPPPW